MKELTTFPECPRPFAYGTDDAICMARESGYTINSICFLDDGLWQVSLSPDPTRSSYKVATGKTIAEAMMACIEKAELAEFKITTPVVGHKIRTEHARISLASLGLVQPMRRRV